TCGHAVLKSERRADRNDPLTYFQVVCVAEFDRGQILRRNANHRDVALGVDTDYFRGVLAPIGQAHRDLARAVHNMRVGQDRAIGADDEAGAFTMHGLLLLRLSREATEERRERTVWPKRVLSLRTLLALAGIIIVVGVLVIRAIGSRDLGYNTDVHDG